MFSKQYVTILEEVTRLLLSWRAKRSSLGWRLRSGRASRTPRGWTTPRCAWSSRKLILWSRSSAIRTSSPERPLWIATTHGSVTALTNYKRRSSESYLHLFLGAVVSATSFSCFEIVLLFYDILDNSKSTAHFYFQLTVTGDSFQNALYACKFLVDNNKEKRGRVVDKNE